MKVVNYISNWNEKTKVLYVKSVYKQNITGYLKSGNGNVKIVLFEQL
jgi:hypothetical protein